MPAIGRVLTNIPTQLCNAVSAERPLLTVVYITFASLVIRVSTSENAACRKLPGVTPLLRQNASVIPASTETLTTPSAVPSGLSESVSLAGTASLKSPSKYFSIVLCRFACDFSVLPEMNLYILWKMLFVPIEPPETAAPPPGYGRGR